MTVLKTNNDKVQELVETMEQTFVVGEEYFRDNFLQDHRISEQGMCMVLGQIACLAASLNDPELAVVFMSQYEERTRDLFEEYELELLLGNFDEEYFSE